MPKLLCNCGNLIDLGEIPCPSESHLIPDIDFAKYFEEKMVEVEKIYFETKPVIKCDKCLRLLVYWGGYDNPPTIYVKE